MGTFLGGLGGVAASPEAPLSWPKIDGEKGELGPEECCSVLNLNMFLLGLGEPPLTPPAPKSGDPKSDPKSSVFNNLLYASLPPPPPSFTGDAFSINPNVCSLDEERQGMNLSLQADEDLDGDEDADRFEIVLGDIDFSGEASLIGEEAEESVWRRRDVSDIDAGRLSPLFLLCAVSILIVLSSEKLVSC